MPPADPVRGEFTLRDYVRVLFRQQAIILVVIFIVMGTVLLGLALKTRVYEARVTMLISAEKPVEAPYYRELEGARNTEVALTQAQLVTSNPVLERTVKALGLDQRPLDYEKAFAAPLKSRPIDFAAQRLQANLERWNPEERQVLLFRRAVSDVRARTSAQPIRDTNMFTVTVKDFSPAMAALTANTISRAYTIFDLEQQLAELELKYGEKHQTVKQLRDNIARMTEGLHGRQVSDVDAIGPASVKVMEQATVPLEPAGTRPAVILAIGFLMSVALGVALAFVVDSLDPTVRSPSEMQALTGLPYIGSIPRKRFWSHSLIRNVQGQSLYAQAYRALSEHIYVRMRTRRLQLLLLTSVLPSEGVSTVIANLGMFLARRAQRRVLLIDANVRSPALHEILRCRPRPGLSDVLEGRVAFEEALQPRGEGLTVLPAGAPLRDHFMLLDSPRMAEVIAKAEEQFDLVLIDCGDIQHIRDSLVLAPRVDAVALVIREGRTRRQVLQASLAPLQPMRAKLIGAIFNDRQFAIPKAVYDWF